MMKPTSYLVNVSRGQVINEESLLRALTEKWIAGAALDVFPKEPLPKKSKFSDLGDNVFVSPHISGGRQTSSYNNLSNDAFVENLRRFIRREELLNVVSRESGY